MTAIVQRPSQDELARLGHEAFERVVRPTLLPSDGWKYVAIALDTDEFEIAATSQEAVSRVRARHPSGEVWIMRTDGSPAFRMRSVR